MATQYDPIAKDESLNTTEQSPRNIADVLAEELDGIKNAISGGGGGGGHTIISPDGTSMTQRAGLGFTDAHISDDSVNDETVVEIVEGISKTDWDNLDPTDPSNNGLYEINDPNNTPILTASEVGYGTGTVKDALDSLLPHNSGGRNALYRGKYLGTSVTADQYTEISNGTFNDLFVGDYWTIDGVDWVIAHFDYWYGTGDTKCTTHHLVIVPRTKLYDAKMNDSDTASGGYYGSKMHGGANYLVSGSSNLYTAKQTIESAFGASHILTHRALLTNAVSGGVATAWNWFDTSIDLMSEIQVYGSNHLSYGGKRYEVGIDKCQFALFRADVTNISIGESWWLRNYAGGTSFVLDYKDGFINDPGASATYGVRPCFALCA